MKDKNNKIKQDENSHKWTEEELQEKYGQRKIIEYIEYEDASEDLTKKQESVNGEFQDKDKKQISARKKSSSAENNSSATKSSSITKSSSAEKDSSPKKNNKKKKKGGIFAFFRFLGWLAIVIVILLLVIYAGLRLITGKVDTQKAEYTQSSGLNKNSEVKNILIIGIDTRGNVTGGRSDVNMILSINSRTGQIRLASLLRDTYVEIPGKDSNRLNAAYEYGGAALLMQTIENNFGIALDEYVLFNFQNCMDVVDAVGGVTIDVAENEVQYVNFYLNEINTLHNNPVGTNFITQAGTQTLNGPQALSYARIRYADTAEGEWGDFGRTSRQRTVIQAILTQMKHAGIGKDMEAVSTVCESLVTSMSSHKISTMIMKTLPLMMFHHEIKQLEIPMTGTWQNYIAPNGADVLQIVDWETNRNELQSIY